MIDRKQWESLKKAFRERFEAKGWKYSTKSENEAYAVSASFSCAIEYEPVIGEAHGTVTHGSKVGIRSYVIWRTQDPNEALAKTEAMI